ncbi:MAG: hypothetical protein AB1899_04230 [Pseudomonadota bacterium]
MDVSVMERTAPVRVERRRNLVLRERFAAAQTLLKPLLGTADSQNGTAFYRAMTRLQNAYPDLTGSEIEALVAAVVRTFQNRQG